LITAQKIIWIRVLRHGSLPRLFFTLLFAFLLKRYLNLVTQLFCFFYGQRGLPWFYLLLNIYTESTAQKTSCDTYSVLRLGRLDSNFAVLFSTGFGFEGVKTIKTLANTSSVETHPIQPRLEPVC